MVLKYRLVRTYSDDPYEAREKSIHPNDMRGVGKASFPRLANFLISLDKGGLASVHRGLRRAHEQ
jgi:hypothetical protein